jgi:hypothetical protein
MKTINDGGPAFPKSIDGTRGMSLRDWFAGNIIQGMFANPSLLKEDGTLRAFRETNFSVAFQAADAMLAARNEGAK